METIFSYYDVGVSIKKSNVTVLFFWDSKVEMRALARLICALLRMKLMLRELEDLWLVKLWAGGCGIDADDGCG
jgi:hypothetical protein